MGQITRPGVGRRRGWPILRDMETVAPITDSATSTWQVLRDGNPVASVATHRDASSVVVATQMFGEGGDAQRIRPHRFPDLEAAESFVRDLVASFSYLGCQVARA